MTVAHRPSTPLPAAPQVWGTSGANCIELLGADPVTDDICRFAAVGIELGMPLEDGSRAGVEKLVTGVAVERRRHGDEEEIRTRVQQPLDEIA